MVRQPDGVEQKVSYGAVWMFWTVSSLSSGYLNLCEEY
jgi:hypothetical protein